MSKQRLIDANALVGPDGLFATRGCAGYCEACKLWSEEGCRVILDAPTVDAVEVVHGRWMVETSTQGWGGYTTHRCDHCNDFFTPYADIMYFCPNCGAKMIAIERPARNGLKIDFVDGKLAQVWGVVEERSMEMRNEDDFHNCSAKMDGEKHD